MDREQGYTSIRMQAGAAILSTLAQEGRPCIWAIVNPDELEFEERTFYVAWTGAQLPDASKELSKFIGTVQLVDVVTPSYFVLHIFEIVSKQAYKNS